MTSWILSHSKTLRTYKFDTLDEAKQALRVLVAEYGDSYYLEHPDDLAAKNNICDAETAPYIMPEEEYISSLEDR